MQRPIVIIADDLSGAAELAGIAYGRGYTAEVQRQFDPASAAEVIAVDTNTRGLPPDEAAARVAECSREIFAAKPAWIYKKVDSVLRGNVRAELASLLAVTDQTGVLLVPANPSRGRTLEGGCLLINGVPVEHTEFARDPEHPRWTASVQELLYDGDLQSMPAFCVPDVVTLESLQRLACGLDDTTLPAGAADFFAALLDCRAADSRRFHVIQPPGLEIPALLVCGSRASWDRRAAECAIAGIPVCSLTAELTDDVDRAIAHLRSANRLLLGIGSTESARSPPDLVGHLANRTALLLERMEISTLLVEGGATAEALTRRLNWSRFAVSAAAPAGMCVVRPLGAPTAPVVWLKPGSYAWPDAVWRNQQ
jgi:uncharacterized protein YgbK (DUF1537 family)